MYDLDAISSERAARIRALIDATGAMTEERLHGLMEDDTISSDERFAGLTQVFRIAQAAVLLHTLERGRPNEPLIDCPHCGTGESDDRVQAHKASCPWFLLNIAITGTPAPTGPVLGRTD